MKFLALHRDFLGSLTGGGGGGDGSSGGGAAGIATGLLGMGTSALASGGMSLIPAALGAVTGLVQKLHADKMAKLNPRGTQTVQSDTFTNQALAQRQAQEGMPAAAYNNQMNKIDQGQANGLMALQGRGSAVAGVGSLEARSDQAGANLNAQDSQMRISNLKNLMQANSAVAQAKQSAFNYNTIQGYNEKAAANRNLAGAGMRNMFNSAQDVGKLGQLSAMGYFGTGQRSNPSRANGNSLDPNLASKLQFSAPSADDFQQPDAPQ